MTIYEVNILHEKAKTKKDGVYSFRGNLWAVKDFRFVAYVDSKGQLLQRFGSFNYVIADLSSLYTSEKKSKLKEWLKAQKT